MIQKKIAALLIAALLLSFVLTAVHAENADGAQRIRLPEGSQAFRADDPGDSDQLAEAYLNRIMPSKGMSLKRTRSPRGENLTGMMATLYSLMLKDITDVANGERSSTVMVYDASVVYPKTEFTAADLGVESILDEDGYLREDTYNALGEIITFDLSPALSALMVDCPYELYWYDKSRTGYVSYPEEIYTYGETITVAGNVSIYLYVSPDYALDGADFECDPAYGQGAQAAAANALEIVNRYAENTDEEKLLGYAQEICALTSYNDEAAAGGASYGNPWQLIWVFDGNPKTNVVCEGYAKAFQYLCDLSTFTGDVRVITVSGLMSGGTGAGDHMWNVVQLDDGYNYIVDVTNRDAGSVGEGGSLLLSGYTEGSLSDGYTFRAWDDVRYQYDDETKSLYDSDMLTLYQNGQPRYKKLIFSYIPSDVTRIEAEAFEGSGVQVVVIPEGCEYVADDAFANCEQLHVIINHSSVDIVPPEGVTVIDE